jgi:hypothetical protein
MTSAISKYDRSIRDAHRGYEYLFQWGNGGMVHKRFVRRIGGDRISKKLGIATGQREKRLGKYRYVKVL